MSQDPLVSVIIPVFNRETLIDMTIESVLSQTYPNWECIVVDDGSTDDSKKIVEGFAKKDARIKIFNRNIQPKGAPVCRNIGIQKAKGDYIIFLDSDDLLAPFCLEERLKYFRQYPEMNFLVFQNQLFKQEINDLQLILNVLNKTSVDDLSRFIAYDYPWQTSSTIFRNKDWDEIIGYWDERLACHQDLDFYIRAIIKNCKYLKIDSVPQVYLRMGNSDKQSSQRLSKARANSKILFVVNIITYLNKAGLLSKYKRSITDLVIFEFAIFFLGKRPGGYIQLITVLIKNRVLSPISIFGFFFDIVYHFLELVKKRFPLLFRFYHMLYGFTKPEIRLKNTPPKNSTLGKITLKEYEELFLQSTTP